VRIINGIHKGKSIVAPKNLPVRPTTDFAKEGLFNILINEFDIEDLTVLDLFSGTGNIAFEFASRGAKKVLCIDVDHACVSFINKTGKALNFHQLNAFKNDVFRYLKKDTQSFDIIFADPPYDSKEIPVIAQLVFENKLLNENGWLIVEHDKRTNLSDHLNFVVQRKYGNVHFSIFKY